MGGQSKINNSSNRDGNSARPESAALAGLTETASNRRYRFSFSCST